MQTPTFTKRESRPYDYQEMTWKKFIGLRKWAKEAVKEVGYPIYLVGSTLKKVVPRDFDIVIVIPLAEYEQKFGKLNEDTVWMRVGDAHNAYVKHYFSCVDVLGEFGRVPLDFKVYPDTWFPDEERLLLAAPEVKQDGNKSGVEN